MTFVFLPDQRGAGHVEAFQFLSVCMSVCVSVSQLNFKTSYWASDQMISLGPLIG